MELDNWYFEYELCINFFCDPFLYFIGYPWYVQESSSSKFKVSILFPFYFQRHFHKVSKEDHCLGLLGKQWQTHNISAREELMTTEDSDGISLSEVLTRSKRGLGLHSSLLLIEASCEEMIK